MRNYRSAMKYYRKRPAKRRGQRRKLPAIAIFLIAFTATFAMTEAYLAGWLDNLGISTGLLPMP